MKHILLVSACVLTLNACAIVGENKPEISTEERETTTQDIISQTQAINEPENDETQTEVVKENKNLTQNQEDDIKVLPENPQNTSENVAQKTDSKTNEKTDKAEKTDKNNDKNNPTPLNVTLRNQPKKSEKTDIQAAKKVVKLPQKAVVVNLPPPKPAKPVLTRRQTLEQEITREKNALKVAQNQLAAAQKAGNAKNIAKLTAAIHDRELNIRAIEQEMKK